jgi:peptidoglycan/LPS O-acetylase OafA/YrhL
MSVWGKSRLWRTALALALFAAAMWFVWLGWDHEYYIVDGVSQGPYRAWQAVGCGLAIATATVFAYLRVPQAAAIFVLAIAAGIGFAVPWAMDASGDETGLWLVGLFFLVVGSCVGLAVLLAVTYAVTGSRR